MTSKALYGLGRWRRRDSPAVLPGREVVSRSDGDWQRATVEEFVRHAMTASRRMLEKIG